MIQLFQVISSIEYSLRAMKYGLQRVDDVSTTLIVFTFMSNFISYVLLLFYNNAMA